MNCIHIHAQPYEHADAYIIGTKQELANLITALQRALKLKSFGFDSCCADGEGYEIKIRVVDSLTNHQLPYTSESARDTREKIIRPEEA
jgi:hypothetical protein